MMNPIGSEAEERTPADVVLRRLQESLFFDASVLRRQQGAGSATAAEGRLGSITFDDIPEYAVDSYNDFCVARAMEKRGQLADEHPDIIPDGAYLIADRADEHPDIIPDGEPRHAQGHDARGRRTVSWQPGPQGRRQLS